MKLTGLKMDSCTGDDNPRLQFKGKRSYFPHIHVGESNRVCTNPKFYRSGQDLLERARPDTITINEAGRHNHDGQKPFDAIAQLLAAAPKLLELVDRLTDGDRMDGSDPAHREARELADRLLALDIPEASSEGWGPYFNEDGTPWEDER
jgi:hypothetical protein